MPVSSANPVSEQLSLFFAEFRPLLTVDETAWMLRDCSADHVRSLLDEGVLRGVDISAAGEESTRRWLRIYRWSLDCLAYRGESKPEPLPAEHILPHRGAMFRRDEVAMILNCTTRHVANLPLEGPRLSSAASAASADRTPRVYRASIIQFLTSREVTT